MCLIAIEGNGEIAERDIRVWKIVEQDLDKNKFRGPYYDAKSWRYGEILKNSQDCKETVLDTETVIEHYTWLPTDKRYVEIGQGFFHAYKDAYAAMIVFEDLASTAKFFAWENLFLCEAIIPKGSVYYDSCVVGFEIASNKIIVFKNTSHGFPWLDKNLALNRLIKKYGKRRNREKTLGYTIVY